MYLYPNMHLTIIDVPSHVQELQTDKNSNTLFSHPVSHSFTHADSAGRKFAAELRQNQGFASSPVKLISKSRREKKERASAKGTDCLRGKNLNCRRASSRGRLFRSLDFVAQAKKFWK